MQHYTLKGLMTAALIGSLALPALAQNTGELVEDGAERHPMIGTPNAIGPGSPGPRHHAGHPGLDLAARLSTLETFVGITPEQQPAWRAYTDALLAFVESGHPAAGAGRGPRPGGARPEAPQGWAGAPAVPGGAQPGDTPQILLAERLAGHAVAQGERAEVLQAAAVDLRAALSSDQLSRLIEAETPRRAPGHGAPGRFGPRHAAPPAEHPAD